MILITMICWGQYDTYCCETKDAAGNCTKLKNTKKYSEAENGASFTFDATNQKPYSGQSSVKNFYVFAQDSYGKISKTELAGGYKLYTNQAPKIEDFVVRSDPDSEDTYFTTEESLDVAMFVEASDDLTNFRDLSYEIKSDGQKIYTAADSTTECKGKLTDYDEAIGIKCHLNGGYDGKERKITLTLTDGYGKTVTTTDAQAVSYRVYQNQAPKILKMPKEEEEGSGDDTGGETGGSTGGETGGDDITVTDARMKQALSIPVNNIVNETVPQMIRRATDTVSIRTGVVTKMYPYLDKFEVNLDNSEDTVLCKRLHLMLNKDDVRFEERHASSLEAPNGAFGGGKRCVWRR